MIKKNLIMIMASLICAIGNTTFAQTTKIATLVSKEDALSIAERQFEGKDVDYYILNNGTSLNWTIFVDAEPTKGWEHECYVLTIPKIITTSLSDAAPTRKVSGKLPPDDNYEPLSVKNNVQNLNQYNNQYNNFTRIYEYTLNSLHIKNNVV